MKKILVLFKTHLDIGFTDFARNVVDKYNKVYIPRAIGVAKELAERNCPEGFVWTVGSWILHQYIQQASPEEKAVLDDAIRKRWIRWHGTAATLYSEVADRDLFAYTLRFSQELDQMYGTKTIGAKCTDVPSHTRAIVPLLAQAGIEFLHIGVNPACVPPDVPDFFRWVAPTGEEVIMMYNKLDYGGFSIIPGTDTGVLFAHTGDNCGPASADDIMNTYTYLHNTYPGVEIQAGDLNDLAMEVRKVREYLPKIYQEIGDPWIHGVGCDPRRMSRFRALLRYAKTLPESERDALFSRLWLISEHTWGMDENSCVGDHDHFIREQFMEIRKTEKFIRLEDSWKEQDDYIPEAIARMKDPVHREEATRLMDVYSIPRPDFSSMTPLTGKEASIGAWNLAWDDTGAVVHADRNGEVFADAKHPLAVFRYEVFTNQEIEDYQTRYMKPNSNGQQWTRQAYGKANLGNAVPDLKEHVSCGSTLRGAYRHTTQNGDEIWFDLHTEGEAVDLYGCPSDMALGISVSAEGQLLFDFAWFDKTACRIPEALWLGFCPVKPLTGLTKLGSVIHPLEVISRGNRELHAVEDDMFFEKIRLRTLDAPLIAVGKPSCYAFYDEYPDTSRGIWANLFNNQWGTNFTMWCEGNHRFRFLLDGTVDGTV